MESSTPLIAAVAALSILAVLGAGAAAAWMVSRALAVSRAEGSRARVLQLMELFAPGLAAADDPRALLSWQPLAAAARKLYAEEFALLDQATGSTFPFSTEQIQAAHARWSAAWLAWEVTHDAEYKLKVAALEEELGAAGSSPLVRARLEAVQREKLDRYQRRYEDYTRVSKALRKLG